MRKDIKLVVFDLDGTLLTKEEVLPDNFYDELKNFNEHGVKIAIASARPVPDAFKIFYNGVDGLLVSCEDGNAFFEGNKLLKINYINPEAVSKVKEYVKGRKDIAVMSSSLTKHYISEEDYQKFVAVGLEHYVPEGPRKLDPEDKIIKINVACAGGVSQALEVMDTLLKDVQKEYEVHETGRGTIGIGTKGTSKAYAIKFFCEYYGISSDEVVVLGDSETDVQMFRVAKYSFAMKNALDAVKRQATFVTKEDNANGGAIKAVKEFLEI